MGSIGLKLLPDNKAYPTINSSYKNVCHSKMIQDLNCDNYQNTK